MFSITCNSSLLEWQRPLVMGIINVTPDSFYAQSRTPLNQVVERAEQMLRDGADWLDVGACSTRPGAALPSEAEEWERLQPALESLREKLPQALISIDTFQPAIAEKAIRQYGVQMINDISGGCEEMYALVTHTPYVLTFNQPYESLDECVSFFQKRICHLQQMGVKDIILDPGFGFSKSLEQNLELLQNLHILSIFNKPVLVGISRKSMIYKPLAITPEEALPATLKATEQAIRLGGSIFRVHDVKETVSLIRKMG